MVSILKKESRGIHHSKTNKRGKSVAFDIDEKSISNPNSFEFDSVVSKMRTQSTRSSPTKFERKNRSYESPKKSNYHHSPVRGRILHGEKHVNKENYDSGSVATLTSYISISERGHSNERVSEPKTLKVIQINESASKLAELLKVDKKNMTDGMDKKRRSQDLYSDENAEPFHFLRIKQVLDENNKAKKNSENSIVSDNYTSISLSNQDSGSNRENKPNFDEKNILAERHSNENDIVILR